MDALALARWQFAITTVYHFLFVPITIGLSAVVAYYHTRWVRHRNPDDLRITKWLGKLFTINFALGLVTGIVQEFQFGMNWSDYSRFVGDIFGAPLAIEALLAFFLESTFLGLWIFGWGKLPEKLHAATMWIVHVGTVLSAYFILSANSFMQNPVGYRLNPASGRAELTDFAAVLTNKVQLVTFPHTIVASYMAGGAIVMSVGIYRMRRADTGNVGSDASMYRRMTRIGAILTLVAGVLVAVTGDVQGKIMTEVQPMKMAAAEALYQTSDSCAPFSIVTVGSLDGTQERFAVTVPCVLSFLATGTFSGKVEGINPLQQTYLQEFGQSGNPLLVDSTYLPNIPLAYWSFRLMIGVGMLSALVALVVLWATRRGRVLTRSDSRWDPAWTWAAILTPLMPVFACSFGWIFTETGRQPWLVWGTMTTATGVSPSVSAGEVLTSMGVFTLLYGVLAVVEVKLFLHYVRKGPDEFVEPVPPDQVDHDAPLVFAY
ncbi:cytochrome ubiquinol oxidase subunit I [Lapillicoccus sp.]|uniref:cytochrome ubiquinol oxidase subunit I n=1 Tax=Lapillicoccus sp. TaxID=1909287 RepID=UPI0032674BF2